ncbi:MAG: phosphoribosyl-AMP cyclohydrolase [Syntrophobacteraceae bacterium CG23_combo_of_CG06-09_8_20_14_all_50_8]|nr:MAG: phosphoribosyl-AMP cyclohydrolase [Syntrophobacteraceae bacterium CG23_combo_of_CG06-09_8_20_14_all_50_8]
MMLEPNFEKCGGLAPVVVQDWQTGEVLMIAYMNRESWLNTLQTGKATYWSRSRNALWMKGESSGNVQHVQDIFIDCDEDAVLMKVEQVGGAACHTGYRSCFYRRLAGGEVEIKGERIFDPEEVYK